MDMELVFSRHPVNLGDGFILFQDFRHPSKGIRLGFKLEIAGYRAADFLGIDDGGVFLNDAPLLQNLNPGFHCHPGQSNLLPDVGIGNASVFNQKPDDLLIQCVQAFQKHILRLP